MASLGKVSGGSSRAVRRRNILIVFTGGTLGMEPDETGALAPVPGFLTKQMKNMAELEDPNVKHEID